MSANHPVALPFFFLTEMWERFGFYVVQGLLVLYMTQYFGYSDSDSYIILGVFTALVYLSPLVGGYVANRYIGFKTAIVWGGLFLIVGYALLSLPYAEQLLYPALATIIVGNGFFKPNISSLLGTQYAEDDPNRDSGFTIFYIGINIGALLAGLSSGYIKEYFGWRMSFLFACIGLIIGVATFLFGLKYIKSNPNEPKPTQAYLLRLFFFCLLGIIAVTLLLNVQWLADWLLPCIGIVCLLYLVSLTMQQTPEYRKKMFVLNILIISSIVFWMLMFQIFYSANLFVDRLVDKSLFGIHLTTTVFYASESVFIILLGPLFALGWQRLGRTNRNPSPIFKFMWGIFFAGLGYWVLAMSTNFVNEAGLIPPLWVFASYLMITIGELFLSPIGLSAVTLLAPPHLVGLMMGVWFVATGFGGMFAGWLAQLSSVPTTVTSTIDKLSIYHHAFLDYAFIAFFVAIVLYFVGSILKRIYT